MTLKAKLKVVMLMGLNSRRNVSKFSSIYILNQCYPVSKYCHTTFATLSTTCHLITPSANILFLREGREGNDPVCPSFFPLYLLGTLHQGR